MYLHEYSEHVQCALVSLPMSAEIIIHEERVVLNASALPDPREVSYDLLLSYVPLSL
jgi:hypothetical protein